MNRIWMALACAALLASPVAARPARHQPPIRPVPREMRQPADFTLRSTAFEPNGPIPAEHTCQGKDVSPALAWSGAPARTRSFALVVDDPDAPDPAAPKVVWVHWVLYDIPARARSLREGVTTRTLPPGTREGLNDWKQPGWRGPCPPKGRHRYYHKLYALDVVLPRLPHPDKAAVEKALEGHILGTAQLIGTYEKH